MKIRNYEDWMDDEFRPTKGKSVKKKPAKRAKYPADDTRDVKRRDKQKKWKSQ
jgi:hypothetical protein